MIGLLQNLQAAAAKAIREEKEGKEKVFGDIAPLRLPKHLTESDRAGGLLAATPAVAAQTPPTSASALAQPGKPNGDTVPDSEGEPADHDEHDVDDDDYDQEYYQEYYQDYEVRFLIY